MKKIKQPIESQVSREMSMRANHAHSIAKNESEAFVESEAQSFDAVTNLANNYSQNKGNNNSWAQNLTESQQAVFERIDPYNKSHGISTERAEGQSVSVSGRAFAGYTAGGAIGKAIGVLGGAEISAEAAITGGLKTDQQNKFSTQATAAENEQYKKDIAEAKSMAKSMSFNEGETSAKSFSETINASSREAQEHRHQAEASHRMAESFDKQASLANNKSSSYGQNLSQDYVNYLGDKLQRGDMQYAEYENALKGDSSERRFWGEHFAMNQADKLENSAAIHDFKNPEQLENAYVGNVVELQQQSSSNDFQTRLDDEAKAQGLWGNQVSDALKTDTENSFNNKAIADNQQALLARNATTQNQVQERQDSGLMRGVLPDGVIDGASSAAKTMGSTIVNANLKTLDVFSDVAGDKETKKND